MVGTRGGGGELTLIDADTERVIAKSMYSKEQIPRLPETFALSTEFVEWYRPRSV